MRSDIQVLRGVAVMAVLLGHAFPQWFPYGYLGVDLFFVISGFLMTKMISERMDTGRFSFADFYVRRARRLLPACYFTLACSTVVGLLVLNPHQWMEFAAELFGALTFTANVMAFKLGASTNGVYPLRHIWSLSLEEQFYFMYPLLLWFIPTRTRPFWLASLASISLATFVATANREAAFFLLPFRAWELLCGGMIFAAGFTEPTRLRFRPLEVIGDWSYSLYLIHWPLLAFASLALRWPLPPLAAFAICFLSIALAALQYQFIEQPLRKRQPKTRTSLA